MADSPRESPAAERPTTPCAPAPLRPCAPLLRIDDLAVSFDSVRAVDGLSLTVHPRQTLAVVGESGCGKTVTALAVLRLIPSPPGRVEHGSIHFGGRDLLALPARELLEVRGGAIAMIFQEPMTSFNPVYTIGDQIVEAVRLHREVGRREAVDSAVEALHDVGLPDPRRRIRSYPHELSGGMRQRAMIAMALACRPKLLLADEPTTALDVTTQAQVLRLLARLQRQTGLGMMLITHDLGVVAQNADVVCVMYAGRPVEYATVGDLFEKPSHPYTRALLKSIPRLGEPRRRLTTAADELGDPAAFDHLPGVVPWWPAMKPPPGASDAILHEVEPGHWVACWRTTSLDEHPPRPPDIPKAEEED